MRNVYDFIRKNGHKDLSSRFADYILLRDGTCPAYGEKFRISRKQFDDSVVVVKAKFTNADDIYNEIRKLQAELKSYAKPLRVLGMRAECVDCLVTEINRGDIAGAAGKYDLARLYDMQDKAFFADDTLEFNRLQSEIEKLENNKKYMVKNSRLSLKSLIRSIEEMIFA